METLNQRTLAVLHQARGDGLSTGTLVRTLHARAATVRATLRALEADGQITMTHGPRKAKVWAAAARARPKIAWADIGTESAAATIRHWNARGYVLRPAPHNPQGVWSFEPATDPERDPRDRICSTCDLPRRPDAYRETSKGTRKECRYCEIERAAARRKGRRKAIEEATRMRQALGVKHAQDTVKTFDYSDTAALIRRTHRLTWARGTLDLDDIPDPVAAFRATVTHEQIRQARTAPRPVQSTAGAPRGTPTKQCKVCIEHLPLTPDYYYANKGTSDDFRPECKVCYAERRTNDETRNALALAAQAQAEEDAKRLEAARAPGTKRPSLDLTGLQALALIDGSGTVTLDSDGRPTVTT